MVLIIETIDERIIETLTSSVASISPWETSKHRANTSRGFRASVRPYGLPKESQRVRVRVYTDSILVHERGKELLPRTKVD